MVATTAPMPSARHDPVPREALARMREERRHGCATVQEWLEATRDLSWLRLWYQWVKALPG